MEPGPMQFDADGLRFQPDPGIRTAAWPAKVGADGPVAQYDDARIHSELCYIDNVNGLKALRAAWDDLTERCEDYSLCVTYQYCEAAANRVFAEGGKVVVANIYVDHGLVALWPVGIHREGLVRVARALTSGADEEYGGPLISDGSNLSILRACLGAMLRLRADILEIPWVKDGSGLQRVIEAAPQPRVFRVLPKKLITAPGYGGNPSYAIRLACFEKWDDFVATLPRALRANQRRTFKQLVQTGRTEFGWCKTVADADAVLEWLVENKRNWAKMRGKKTPYLMDDRLKIFFRALARETDLSTTPLVAFIKVNDVPVAASLSLVGPRSLEYFIATYDQAFGRYSVGALLLSYMAHWSYDHCLDFDMRYAYESYKARWANEVTYCRTHLIYLTTHSGPTLLALLALQIPRAKTTLRRLSGQLTKKLMLAGRTTKARLARRFMPSTAADTNDPSGGKPGAEREHEDLDRPS
jgi:CelD/BcsL family acetyltransferase involved in cellulose biosynthesis